MSRTIADLESDVAEVLLTEEEIETRVAELGAWKAGATVFPLNPLYTENELAEPLRDAGVEIVVALTPFYRRLKEIQPETRVKRIIATSIKEYLPPFLRVLFTLFKEKKDGHRQPFGRFDFPFAFSGRIIEAAQQARDLRSGFVFPSSVQRNDLIVRRV